jgi:hypothetical protein
MTLDLFAALGAIPRLPGARCRGRHELFDPPDPNDPDCDDAQSDRRFFADDPTGDLPVNHGLHRKVNVSKTGECKT